MKDQDDNVTRRISYCRICEQLCGIVADVSDGKVVKIRGDILHPVSKGYICPKGANMGQVQSDPDRIRHPLRRTNAGTYVEVDWDTALDDIARRLQTLVAQHGPDSVAMYLGNPAAFSLSHMFWAKGLMDAIGSKHFYTAAAQDSASRSMASHLLYGSPVAFPIPDVVRTDFLLIVGANPMVSHGSLLSLPPIGDRMRAVVGRGGRVVVVDPARTKTAATFEHQPIRPGTDAWLLGAMINVMFEHGLVDRAAVAGQATGLAEFEEAIQRFTVNAAVDITGIDVDAIRKLALDFAAAPSAVAYGRVGVGRYPGSTVVNVLLDALNIVSGNFGRPGGSMFVDAPVDLAGLAAKFGQAGVGSVTTRIGNLPDVAGHLPWVLSEEINTAGAGQPRALIITAGNPVLSAPGGDALTEAMKKLELVVSIDLYLNESAQHADYVLPAPTFLERSDVPVTFSAHMPIPWLQAATPVLDAPPGVREEWWIFEEIAKRMGRGAASGQSLIRRLGRWGIRPTPRLIMDALLRTSSAGDWFGLRRGGLSISRLEAQPHGIALKRPRSEGHIGAHIGHADKKVHLAEAPALDGMRRLAPPQSGLMLIGRRQLSSINSWMHNVGSNTVPTLHVNPADAQAHGVESGDEVEISVGAASVIVTAEVTDAVIPGVVSYPHGWGHHGGWQKANALPGANINRILSADVAEKDPLSGASHLDAVRVSIRPHNADNPTAQDDSFQVGVTR